ncbi:MAG: helix-turn-helix domain-containing protein [Acidobacteria bacterium]|jgi:transcriptional regulator with XRE-family HTH domain|nr:helix-turn-helix domain-containing protein [Acidobacteriota bacterium]
MLNSENIGKRLRQVREFFKFTQQRMAEVVRIQESTYKRNEKGLPLLNMNSLDQLHDELGITRIVKSGINPIQDIEILLNNSLIGILS